jgi:hypothetical protein
VVTNLRDYFRSSSENSTPLSTPDRASPMLLLLNQSLYKWRTTGRVWCVNFHHEGGIYRGEWDLHWLGEVGLTPSGGRSAKPRGRPVGWSGFHRLGFSSSCRRLAPKAWVKPPQTLAGRPTPIPTQPAVWPTWSTCQIHLRGDDDFDIWSTSLCHPLKWSNLVPMFLKSNKH